MMAHMNKFLSLKTILNLHTYSNKIGNIGCEINDVQHISIQPNKEVQYVAKYRACLSVRPQ